MYTKNFDKIVELYAKRTDLLLKMALEGSLGNDYEDFMLEYHEELVGYREELQAFDNKLRKELHVVKTKLSEVRN